MNLVLDNTVLSNFALVERTDLLRYFVAEGITGTLGLLTALVEESAVSRDEGNQVLQQMIARGYRCPVERL